jgi:hypothetical protein
MTEPQEGCARVTGAVLGGSPAEEGETPKSPPSREEARMIARVGRKAPDFNAPAYHQGTFKNVQLSDHFGKWILLCFYPGDFTFV